MNSRANRFHGLAKDAGNKLRAYILSVSSGAAGVYFLALTGERVSGFSLPEKVLLIVGIISFVLTVLVSLYELRIDSQRFFLVAKELEKDAVDQHWERNESLKTLRYFLIHFSYFLNHNISF